MQWVTLISALSGGVLGVGATLLVDRVRAKRELGHRLNDARWRVYTEYLVALTETDGALQILALSRPTPVDRVEAMTVFRSKPLLAMRYQVDLIAPPPVAAAAEAAYQRLREIREIIVTTSLNVRTSHSTDRGSAEWEAVHKPYINAIDSLRTAMRQDVQGSYIIPVA